MKKIDENIYYKRIRYYNIYIIKGPNGDILIDTGFRFMKRTLKKTLDKFNIKLIILTHVHIDHSWNTAYLSKRYKAKIAVSKNDLSNIDNSNIVSYPSKKRYKLWTKIMHFGMKHFKQDKYVPDILLIGDKEYTFNGVNLKIIDLKGHTTGSIGILYNNYLFAGDALVNRKKYVEIAYQNQDNDEALKSMLKIKEIHPKIIFIGHDRPIKYDKYLKSIKKQ